MDGEHRKALGLPVERGHEIAARADARVDQPSADVPPPPDNYPEYVTWYFKFQGKDMAKCGESWKQHRDTLQAA